MYLFAEKFCNLNNLHVMRYGILQKGLNLSFWVLLELVLNSSDMFLEFSKRKPQFLTCLEMPAKFCSACNDVTFLVQKHILEKY